MKERTYKEIERLTIWANGIIQGMRMSEKLNDGETTIYFNPEQSVLSIKVNGGTITANVYDREEDGILNHGNPLELKVGS